MKKTPFLTALLFLTSCTLFSEGDKGQVIYNWERAQTGIEKFSRDHSECLRLAEDFSFLPDFSSFFYTEEAKKSVVADWHSTRGIWATYVPYRGAQPLIINSLRDDDDISPGEYRACMEDKGYSRRIDNVPDITNIYVYTPQRTLQTKPSMRRDF